MIETLPVCVNIADGPVQAVELNVPDGAGAALEFRGIVRPLEEGRPLVGLNYQTYDPMAHMQLQKLAVAAVRQFQLFQVQVAHSRGFVPAGSCSMQIALFAGRRKSAIAAMDWLIDHIKQDVPIWKSPLFDASTVKSEPS